MSGALAPDDASYRLGGLPPCRYGEHPVDEPLRKTWSQSPIVSGRADRKVFQASDGK